MANLPSSSIVDLYVDLSKVPQGGDDGFTPVNAWSEPRWAGIADEGPQTRIWVRRNANRVLNYDWYGSSSRYFPAQVIKWPVPGERFYSLRPQAGIDAGWDNDPDVDPVFAYAVNWTGSWGFQPYNCEHYGIHFFACTSSGAGAANWPPFGTDPTAAYAPDPVPQYSGVSWSNGYSDHLIDAASSGGTCYFSKCKFSAGADTFLSSLIGMSDSERDLTFDECEFYQHTFVPFHNSNSYRCRWNSVLSTSNWAWPFTYNYVNCSVLFRNCLFDGIYANDPYSDPEQLIRSGVVVSGEPFEVTFEGCTFRNISGRLLGAYEGKASSGYTGTAGNGFSVVHAVGCTFEDGVDVNFNWQDSYYNLHSGADPYWGYTPYPEEYLSWQDDSIMNYAVSFYRCKGHPLSNRYVFDAFTYTLYETTSFPRAGGNEFQYVIQPKADIQGYLTNSPNKYRITPQQTTFPVHENLGAWTIPPNVGVSMTLTVYVKTFNWSQLPAPDDLFFFVHYGGSTGYARAQRAWSTQAVTQNDQWTALSVTFTPTVDIPIQCRMSLRCYEVGAPARTIVLDPAVVVT